MDRGHKMTDDLLAELEKRVKAEYKTAHLDMERKLNNYLMQFDAEDKVQRAKLKAGEITAKEYRDWRIRKTAIGDRWQAMRDTLAEDMHNANQIALSISKGYRADAYALNRNYAVYQIEHDAKIDLNYTLYDHHTAQRLLEKQQKMLPAPRGKTARMLKENPDLVWNKQHLQSAVLQGILQGEKITDIAGRLRDVTDMNLSASIRNARTMVTGAQNAGRIDGYKYAQDKGVDLQKEWMATLDGRTRHSHRLLHGERIGVDETFSNGCKFPGDPDGEPAEVYNCFIPSTVAGADSDIVRSYSHWYSGKVVSITTASGVQFTCTPNHPILTDGGWVKAGTLNKGDNLLVTRIGDDMGAGGNPNINHVLARMDTLHKFVAEFSSERACGLSVDFHGDIAASNVEVVTKERFLRRDGNPCGCNGLDKFILEHTDEALMGKCSFMKHLRGIARATLGYVCRMGKALSLFDARLGHPSVHGFGTVSDGGVTLTEYPIDNLPTDGMFGGESLDGLTSKVFVDNVVAVDFGVYNGHVYNLQTENGYYFVNSIIPSKSEKFKGTYAIVHNCRCTLIGQIKGYETDRIESSPKMGEMTFEEWQGQKKIARPDNEQDILKQFNVYDKSKRTAEERLKLVNPHYNDAREYRINCQRTVVAHEMQWRGYDVEARPYAKDKVGNSGIKCWDIDWNNARMDKGFKSFPKRSDVKNGIETAMQDWGDGSRAFVRVKWQSKYGGNGHFFSVRNEGGKVVYEDPQTGLKRDIDNTLGHVTTARNACWLMRVDNRDLTDLVELAVKNRG